MVFFRYIDMGFSYWNGSDGSRHQSSRVVVAAALLAGWAVVAVHWQMGEIDRLAQANVSAAAERLIWLTRIAAFVLCLFTLTTGTWIWWIGHRACRASQFPPPDTQVLGAKYIQTGRKARVIGWCSQAIGFGLFILGSISAWLLVQLAELILPK